MHVGVLGINHKLADIKLRETLAKATQSQFFPHLHETHSFIILSTCNRLEVYFSSDNPAETHSYLLNVLRQHVGEDFEQKLYTYFEKDCFWHLCRVVSGLDSAIVAESEIQGQVKAAYEKAATSFSLPSSLHFLFQKALKVGKGIRTDLPLGRGIPDLEHALFALGTKTFDDFLEKKILFVGASAINLKIAHFFRAKTCGDLTLCNRTKERGEKAALRHNLHHLPWERLSDWSEFDAIIFGTKSPEPLISYAACSSKKLIVDLCIPRNVDPAMRGCKNIALYDIDELNQTLKMRKERMQHHLMQAERKVAFEAKKQVILFQNKDRNRLRVLPLSA